jgi:hypothetical protein
MKKTLIPFVLLLATVVPLRAQWWQGYSERTGLVLSLYVCDTGVVLYSPLQTDQPIPASQWSLQDDTLRLKCHSIGFSATLAWRDSLWTGYWKQGLLKEDIVFHPTDTLLVLRRPQEPVAPYRFEEEEVVADYTDSRGNEVHLEGTLTYPRFDPKLARMGVGDRHPCIVLVSGSGQQDRNEEIMRHKPFLVLADYLAQRGIAVLRYDDRGVGGSLCTTSAQAGSCLDSADTRLLSEDAEAMFRAARRNRHVDTARLGMGGHSEGGAIAPMVAARNKDVKFVVMMAGQGVSGTELLVDQNRALFRAKGVSERLCNLRAECMRDLLALPAGSKTSDYTIYIEQYTQNLTKAEADSIGLGKKMVGTLRQQLRTPWMRSFLKLEPASYLPLVKCPILAMNGAKDCQVTSERNLHAIMNLTSGHAECMELPDLNHLFQHCTTGSADEYIFIEETFAPEAMKAIADWILRH